MSEVNKMSEGLSKEARKYLNKEYPMVECANCGKKRVRPVGEWAYTVIFLGKRHFCCSWKCYRAFEKKCEKEKKERKKNSKERGFAKRKER